MNWIERFNEAIRYLEENLTGEIEYERLGQIACCSAYHFQRMFVSMAGMPLSEYIRKRKMSLAAVDLQGGAKVIDAAEKYGYASPTAFNRAFQSVHGVSPSAVKRGGAAVKSFPPIALAVTVKGAEAVSYRIEAKKAFRIVGVSAPLDREMENNFTAVPRMWQTAAENGTLRKLSAVMGNTPAGFLGVSMCGDREDWTYWIAVASEGSGGEFKDCTVPASVWAVFSGAGTNRSVQELERRIFAEWLPASGYEYGNAPDIEVYLNPDPQNTVFEIWIPVRKKKL